MAAFDCCSPVADFRLNYISAPRTLIALLELLLPTQRDDPKLRPRSPLPVPLQTLVRVFRTNAFDPKRSLWALSEYGGSHQEGLWAAGGAPLPRGWSTPPPQAPPRPPQT